MRRPQSPETVYLKTLLVMLVFLKVSKEVLGCPKCELKEVSTSNITIKGNSSCTVGDNYQSTPKDNDLLVSNLNPGTSYNLTVNCSTECCNLQVTTRPDVIRNLSVTEITTSSVSLNWTEPQGKSSVYRVEWNDSSVAMNETRSQTSMNITSLTAGAQYVFRVFAVAEDNQTTGDSVNKTQYTRPDVIRNLSVTEITTSSVSLNWTEPQGKSSVYRVVWDGSTVAMNETVQTSMNITGLTAGVQYMFRVFAVAGDNQTAGDSVNKTQYTRPDVIRNLSVTEITTSSVFLNWTEPQGKSSVYRVAWDGSTVAMNETVQTSMNITGLTAGVQYVFRVFAVAGDNQTAGDSVNKTQYTKPNMPSNVKAVGSTTNMNVTWRSSSGDDSNYTVEICNSSRVLIDKRTVSSIQPVVFSNLRPGHLYIVKVIIHSGPFNASSNITNATYPNPPEAIRVEEQTTISLKISWGRPLDMDPGQYNFTVFRSDHQPMTLADNWALVENLTSGTQYNISVATVGPWGYQSVPVQISATTRPQPVNNLRGKEITTSGITLIWEQPEPKEHYTYHVRVAGPNGTQRNQTVSSTSERIEKLQSGYNHTFTVTTLTADGTTASPQSISLFTRPFPVTGLNASKQNTSTVYLSWNKPLGYQHYYTYRVETTQCPSAPKNQSERNESAYVTDLRSGSNCSFTVFSQVGNEIEGEAVSISQYTKPEKLAPSVSSHTNDSITVTWDSPSGTVEMYVVNLASRDGENSTKELNSSNRSYKFARLMAGKIYTVKLKTVSGPFTEESEPVSNATYPNQPGPIILKEKTTNSIAVEWGEAPGMVKGSFNYTVFYQPSTNLIITQKNTINLIGLLPGIAYNISVTSLGPLTLSSLPVHIQQVTRPKKVSNLKVNSTSVDEVTLQWSSSRFRYRVETAKDSYETNLTRYQVRNLTPGTEYTFSVITLAFDGTEGGPRSVEVCTDAAPVTDLSCRGPNLTQAVLMLSWTKPRGANQGFQVNSNNNSVERKCQDSCSHNLTGLLYNKAYTVKIWTLGCQKKKSAITEIPCKTGITVPPVPDTADVSISGKEYNRFTLQLKPNLFNDTNGPIESYGVLVTSQLQSLSGENKSSLQNYLTKTYEDWTVERTTTYLALIKDMGSRNRNGDDGRVVVVGDGTKSHSYNNGPLSALGTYSFAVVTFTNLELNNGIVSVGKSFFSISEFSHEEIFLPVNPVVVGGAAGGTLAVLLILIIATVIAAIWLKRLSKKQSSEVPLYSIRAKVSSPVKVENYEAYFRQHQADSNCGFAEQFENLKTVGVAQAKSSAIMLENKGKNRYNNVLPCEYAQNLWFYRTTQNLHSFKLSVGNQKDDSSRVKLSAGGSAYDDYINANYMPGYNSRKEFIAAQGPLPSTVNDFWRMIWEKNVHTLVMLTRCNEQGRVKCEKYWPSGAGHYNNITVTTTSEIPLEDWTIRDFSVKNVRTAETRTVSHFHFTAWPDHGVPETTELLINFRHLVREHMDQYSRHFPTVVHCSAGVGRTGTFIAIDRLIFQIERDSVVDVYGVVHDLRMHRPLMVQTEDQLVFLNQCALDIIRSRTGTNVDLIYQNTAALSIYENFEPMKNSQNGCNT